MSETLTDPDLFTPSEGHRTTPPHSFDLPNRIFGSFTEAHSAGPPSPPIALPPLPTFLPKPLELDNERTEIRVLKLASAEGRLQDVHQVLAQYILSHVPDPITGRLRLMLFAESIREAILHQQLAVLSYLFFMRVGEPRLHIWTALEVLSPAIFQIFLDYGWDINQPLERALPPALGYVSKDQDLTEWFLDHGADPNAMCAWDLTPMSEAMCQASLDTIRFLFDHGGNIERGQLLHHAVQRITPDVLEVIELLLEKGASINEVQYKNHARSWTDRSLFGLGTPLHYAAQLGNLQVVEFLLSRGADPLIKDSTGWTPLQVAAYHKQSSVVELLRRIMRLPK